MTQSDEPEIRHIGGCLEIIIELKAHPDGCQCLDCLTHYQWPKLDKLIQHPSWCRCSSCQAWRGSRQGG